jgi:hypothetical protein
MPVLTVDTQSHEHAHLRRAAPGWHPRGARCLGLRPRRTGSIGAGLALPGLRPAARFSHLRRRGDDPVREPGMRSTLLGPAGGRALRARPVRQLQPLARLLWPQPRPRSPRSLATPPWEGIHDACRGGLHPRGSLQRLQSWGMLAAGGPQLPGENESLLSRLHPDALSLALEAACCPVRRMPVMPAVRRGVPAGRGRHGGRRGRRLGGMMTGRTINCRRVRPRAWRRT